MEKNHMVSNLSNNSKGKLDISSLKRAYETFINVLNYDKLIESNESDNPFYAKEAARSAVIQHFEYTYELSWKMIKKFIKMDEGREESLTRRELFRHAGEKGLIIDFHKWMDFHDARNLTSHTYDEDTAQEVYIIAKEFESYVKDFIQALEEKIKRL